MNNTTRTSYPGGTMQGATACSTRYRGSAYLLVLYLTLITAVTGMALSVVAVRTSRTATGEADAAAATMLAQAGLDLVLAESLRDPAWRSSRSPGLWMDGQACDPGTVTTQALGSEVDFTTNPAETLTITATGDVNGTKRTCQVLARSLPLEVLKSGLHAHGDVRIEGMLTCSGPVTTNGSMEVRSGARLEGDAAAVGTIVNNGIITGETIQGADPWQMPPSDWVNQYAEQAVVIPHAALDGNDLRELLLSPTSNPLTGETSPLGLYLIEAEGHDVKILRCRILGTLVIRDANTVEIKEDVNWEPAVLGWPALLNDSTRDRLKIRIEYDLDEDARAIDFNEDGDQDDVFPKLISGLVWSRLKIEIDKFPAIEGAVITEGTLLVKDTVEVAYQADLYNHPPPGNLYESPLQVIEGSYQIITTHLGEIEDPEGGIEDPPTLPPM